MQNILFASDLDNTLLFSWRHRQEGDVCVEWLDGREQGFCTPGSLAMLAKLNRELLFIPVTSRSVEQYRRIAWPAACRPRYAVTTNGGILLAEGEVDRQWLARTRELIEPWQNELRELAERLAQVAVSKRSRMVDDIYLFAACDKREDAEALGAILKGTTSLDTAVSGRKVYFFPPPLNKGKALLRLKERFRSDKTLCAGDTVIDLPMLAAADLAIIPEAGLLPEGVAGERLVWPAGAKGARFPDFVLAGVLNFREKTAGISG